MEDKEGIAAYDESCARQRITWSRCAKVILLLLALAVGAGCLVYRTINAPDVSRLVGDYEPDESTAAYSGEPGTRLTLAADGTFIATNVPDAWLHCYESSGRWCSGAGTWRFTSYDSRLVQLDFPEDSLPGILGRQGMLMEVRGWRAPFELEITIGDPDEGRAARLKKTRGHRATTSSISVVQ